MSYANRRLLLLVQVVVCLSVATMAPGQPMSAKPMSDADLTALLQSRMKQADDLRDLDDAGKAKVKELLQQALGELEATKRWTEKAAQFEKDATQGPVELRQTKATLATLPTQPTIAVPSDASLPQIEQAIAKREADLEQWRTTLASVEKDLTSRATRRVELPKQITAAKDRLNKINGEFPAPGVADDNSPEGFARRMVLVARRRTVEQEIASYEKELAAYEALTELLPLRRDLGVRQVALAEQEIKRLQELANRRRQQEAEQQLQRASREVGQAPKAVHELLKRNAALAETRKSLAAKISETIRQLDLVNQELNTVEETFKRDQEMVAKVGETNAIGLRLRKERVTLPNLENYYRNIRLRQQTMRNCQLDGMELHDSRRELANLDQRTQAVLQKLDGARNEENTTELEVAVREALKAKSDYLDAVIDDNNTYFQKLGELDNAEQQLIRKTEQFTQFIDERVLWIASAVPLKLSDFDHARKAFWWLVRPGAFYDVGGSLLANASENRTLTILAVGVFMLLIGWRRRLKARIQAAGEKAARGSCHHFLPTLEATVFTILTAAAWPGLMWYLGWRLTTSEASELCKALGHGLTETAKVFLALELLRRTCCHRGLGECHFGWPAAAMKLLRQNIRWFSLPVLPLMCVAVAMAWQEMDDRWDTSLGRICFMAAVLCFSLVLHRVLRPGSVVFQAMIAERRGGWLERLRYVWYPLCMLTPVALAVLAAVGYHYTARQLVTRLILTTYVLVGGMVARALLLRWTVVNRRNLAIDQARKRRAAMSENNAGEENSSTADLPTSAVEERDLATINIQTRRLVEYSLAVACALAVWCAWIDVLPALNSVNPELWQTTVVVTEKQNVPGDGDKVQWTTTERPRSITLATLCLVAIILATTVIAAKNTPGLLEMTVLQHLPLDGGARYAVATVFRYGITLVGVLLCCGSLGVGWSKVQWLVAAMSLGLGFGLQEIFANFVSGLIILFERPIRVGDVVTIDGTTGVVSRIRIRATTVTDGDRKELVIPNKEFITGRLLNWTLSDPVNRLTINVGIAYGSDTQQATDILLRIAREHPNVLDNPFPEVMFESFGDSALNFILRCFLPNLENRAKAIHELHMAIDREFREANIEIAFPQQDVHVRSIDMPLPQFLAASDDGGVLRPAAAKPAPVERAA